MATTEAKVKIDLKMEIDEEQLKDIFESYDIKFTKKKAKELNTDLNDNWDVWFSEMEEAFQEVVGNWLQELFDE